MRHLTTSVTAVCLCASIAVACASGSGSTLAPENVDLSGSWALNAELSDRPDEMMQERGMSDRGTGGRQGGMRPGSGGGRPSGGMGGRGGMRGGAASQTDQQRMQQTMRMATQAPRRLVVDQQDSTVTIRDGGGRTVMLHTNWKTVKQEIENGGEVEIRARWRGRELQIERDVHLGGKIMQAYYLSPDTGKLHVENRLEMGRGGQERVFHFVYDAVNNQL